MSYTDQTWVNGPTGNTPLSSDRLNHQEAGIKEQSNRLDTLEPQVAAKAPLLTATGVKTANYTAVTGDFVQADATSASRTVTLPLAIPGQVVAVKKVDSSANTVTITLSGSDTLDGSTSNGILRLRNEARTMVAITGGWITTSGLLRLTEMDSRYTQQSLTQQGNISGAKPETIPAIYCTSSASLSTGDVAFAYFTPQQGQAITQLTTVSTGATQVGATLIKFGLYTVASNGDLTLAARTVNGSGTAWASTTALSTLALDSAINPGGTYTLVSGQRYAFAVLGVGMSTAAKLLGNFQTSSGATNFALTRTGHIGSQTELATTYTNGAISNGFSSFIWGGMS